MKCTLILSLLAREFFEREFDLFSFQKNSCSAIKSSKTTNSRGIEAMNAMIIANAARDIKGTNHQNCFLTSGFFFNVITRLRSIQNMSVAQTKPNAIAQPIFPVVSEPLWVKYQAADVPDKKAINDVTLNSATL